MHPQPLPSLLCPFSPTVARLPLSLLAQSPAPTRRPQITNSDVLPNLHESGTPSESPPAGSSLAAQNRYPLVTQPRKKTRVQLLDGQRIAAKKQTLGPSSSQRFHVQHSQEPHYRRRKTTSMPTWPGHNYLHRIGSDHLTRPLLAPPTYSPMASRLNLSSKVHPFRDPSPSAPLTSAEHPPASIISLHSSNDSSPRTDTQSQGILYKSTSTDNCSSPLRLRRKGTTDPTDPSHTPHPPTSTKTVATASRANFDIASPRTLNTRVDLNNRDRPPSNR
uniref:Uncharacterized protein n=1 Tax=Knipowitschia caucasica TaxID=637954 RepID=A0AAV2K811_KNICA